MVVLLLVVSKWIVGGGWLPHVRRNVDQRRAALHAGLNLRVARVPAVPGVGVRRLSAPRAPHQGHTCTVVVVG